MKNRKSFIQTMGFGLLLPALGPLGKVEYSNNIVNNPIVKNGSEGETYYVRENTPITIYLSKKDNIDSVSICMEDILPGNGIPTHKHLHEDEVFFVLKGSGVIRVDEKEFKISSGSSAYVPKATWHEIRNTGSELLTFIFGFSPAGFEDFFRQIGTLKGTPFKAKPQDEAKLLAEKYGMVFK